MSYDVALVTDRAGTFATILSQPVPRLIEDGRILVTTLATFDRESDALAFLQAVRWVEERARERMPGDQEVLERHGLAPVRLPAQPDVP